MIVANDIRAVGGQSTEDLMVISPKSDLNIVYRLLDELVLPYKELTTYLMAYCNFDYHTAEARVDSWLYSEAT